MLRIRRLPAGKTQTVESFWNAKATAFFREPAGAVINVKYGKGWASVNRQRQVLNGTDYMKLEVGAGAVVFARMRVKVRRESEVTYGIYPGEIVAKTPEEEF